MREEFEDMKEGYMRQTWTLKDGWEFSMMGRNAGDFQTVTLPHDWAISQPFEQWMEEGESQGFRNHFYIGWYRRTLQIPEKKPGYCYLLNFGGVYENSTVYVNGIKAGGRQYGYSSFSLDVTEFLTKGDNLLEVEVDSRACPTDRWYGGSGIYRNVTLVCAETLHLDPWKVKIKSRTEGADAVLEVDCGEMEWELPEGWKLEAALCDETGKKAAAAECNKSLKLQVEKAQLWSAEKPYLYTLFLTLSDGERERDGICQKVGIKNVELIPNCGILVNGKKIRLKGVCLHQDTGAMGIAAKKEIYRQRLLALKEMGCNAIRAAHHTFSEEFLELCDEMGFYVYEECFDKWHGGHYGKLFETEWQKDVDAMVRRDRNHPCILIWGVGNEVENQAQPSMLATLKLLTNYVRSLDPDRLVSYAMNPHFKYESKEDVSKIKDIQQFVDEVSDTEIYDNADRVERIARIAKYVDVISCNYQEQWYPLIHKRLPEKLILGTETYQYFMGHEDQMQNFTQQNPNLIPEKEDYVIGSFIWTGIDYLGESMGYPAKGWGGSLIRTNGNRRPGYYMFKSYWNEAPMVYFCVMDYSLADEGVKEHWDMPILAEHWSFPQFHKAVIPYMIMSNCEEVGLFLNGKRFFIRKPAECENRVITGFLPWQAGCVEVVGYCQGKEVCRRKVETVGVAVQLQFQGDAWTFKGSDESKTIKVPAEYGYQVQLAVAAKDARGNHSFRESAKVRFSVEGPAKILAVDNGDITGNEPYQAESIHLYHGQASVILALTGKKGRICIHADADGMSSGYQIVVAE